MLSYEKIEQSIKNILNNRLDSNKAKQFKKLLQQLKENFGFSISKQFIKKTLFDNNSREFQKVLNQRINRIIKRAEIQTEKQPLFYRELKSEKGVLYYDFRKKYLTFLIV